MGETSTKPYLLRALHEWCTDNGYTPYIVVQVDEHTVVPIGHVQEDGQIVLDISMLATNRLRLGNEFIDFQARFDNVAQDVFVPVGAVSAIYAQETGAGMGFEVEVYVPSEQSKAPQQRPSQTADSATGAPESDDKPDPGAKHSHLSVVK